MNYKFHGNVYLKQAIRKTILALIFLILDTRYYQVISLFFMLFCHLWLGDFLAYKAYYHARILQQEQCSMLLQLNIFWLVT